MSSARSAHEVAAPAEQVPRGAHRAGVDIGHGQHAAAQEHGDLVGVDLVVLSLAAVDGFHVQGVAEDEGEAFARAQVGDPIPGEDALDGHHEVVAVRGRWWPASAPGWPGHCDGRGSGRRRRGCRCTSVWRANRSHGSIGAAWYRTSSGSSFSPHAGVVCLAAITLPSRVARRGPDEDQHERSAHRNARGVVHVADGVPRSVRPLGRASERREFLMRLVRPHDPTADGGAR